MRWIVAAFYAVGVLLFGTAATMAVMTINFRRASLVAEATVVDNARSRLLRARPVYRFTTADGKTITGTDRYTRPGGLPIGTREVVRYRIADPSSVERENEMWWWNSSVLALFSVLWTWTVAKNVRRMRARPVKDGSVRPRIRKLPR